jgi:dephospho-CoA kinase
MNKVIGIAGPIGSGKDEVVKILKTKGATVVDADLVGHSLLAENEKVALQVFRAFGGKIKNKNGSINRKKLAKIVFSDEKKLQKLNELIHPAIFELISKQTAYEKEQGSKLVVINAALLFEIGLDLLCTKIWIVEAPASLRLKRLIKRGYSKKEALLRIEVQGDFNHFTPQADEIIMNDSTLAALKRQVLKALLRRFCFS